MYHVKYESKRRKEATIFNWNPVSQFNRNTLFVASSDLKVT